MQHAFVLKSNQSEASKKPLARQALGQFYTPQQIGISLIDAVVGAIDLKDTSEYSVIDPFCGDGRLLVEFLYRVSQIPESRYIKWTITFWDVDENAVEVAARNLGKIVAKTGLHVNLSKWVGDSFMIPPNEYQSHDCVITNPPWETLKPDNRWLKEISSDAQKAYVQLLRDYDRSLADRLPHSQPSRKYAGWGTNLSRCGLELSMNLIRDGGICGIVVPLSLLTDHTSSNLRAWLLNIAHISQITHYPAELQQFDSVDQEVVFFVATKTQVMASDTTIVRYDRNGHVSRAERLQLSPLRLSENDYCIPVNYGSLSLRLLDVLDQLRTVASYEGKGITDLWLGRELDETRHKEFLSNHGKYGFLKGRMVGRYCLLAFPSSYVSEDKRTIPRSASFHRLAWRDVSRRSQERRVYAAIIPPNVVTGNSLHVAHFRNNDRERLNVLLAVFNSIPFEFQARANLGTGHVSAGVVRKIRIPDIDSHEFRTQVLFWLTKLEEREPNAEITLEVVVAKAYGLGKDTYSEILDHFDKMPEGTKTQLLEHALWGHDDVALMNVKNA